VKFQRSKLRFFTCGFWAQVWNIPQVAISDRGWFSPTYI